MENIGKKMAGMPNRKQKCERPKIAPHNMESHTEAAYKISIGCDLKLLRKML